MQRHDPLQAPPPDSTAWRTDPADLQAGDRLLLHFAHLDMPPDPSEWVYLGSGSGVVEEKRNTMHEYGATFLDVRAVEVVVTDVQRLGNDLLRVNASTEDPHAAHWDGVGLDVHGYFFTADQAIQYQRP